MPPTGLEAYLAQQQANQQQSLGALQQAQVVQTLQEHADKSLREKALRASISNSGGDVEAAMQQALKAGDVAAAHQLAPLVESMRKQKQMQQLQGMDLNALLDNPQAALAAQALNPHIGPEIERLRAVRDRGAELAAMKTRQGIQPDPQEVAQAADDASGRQTTAPQATPAQPGVFAPFLKSEVPGISDNARMWQDQVDKAGQNVTPGQLSQWRQAASYLANKESSYQQAQALRDAVAGNKSQYTNIQPDGKGGFIGLSNTTKRMEAIPMAPGVNAPSSMDEDALKNAAWEKLLFGKEPSGMGNSSAAQRAQVRNEAARVGKELGLTPMEMAMLPQDNKVKMKAVDTLTKWGATVARSAEKLDLDLGVALDYAKKLPLTQIQFINRAVVAGQKEFNSPDANAYATAINSVRQEYARLMSGPTSNAMLPVEAMKKGNELLSSGVDAPSLVEVGNQMRRDAANTITATNHQINGLRGSIQGLGKGDYFQQPTPSAGGGLPSATDIDAEIARRKRGR